jgi:uncharacterized membrane protein YhaH (DUF805 family)
MLAAKGAIMLANLFSFHGRMARLEFLGWSIASLATVFVTTAILVFGGILGAKGLHAGKAQAMVLVFILSAVMFVMAMWSSLAICAKRIRDMGLSPLVVLGVLIVFDIVDALVLTRYTSARFFWPFAQYTMVGGIVNVAALAAMLFWPGQGEDGGPRQSSANERLFRPQAGMAREGFGVRAR